MPAVIAAIGMLWAKRQGKGKFRAYHDLVFERFWRRELDIEDPEAIAAVILKSMPTGPVSAVT